jgi:hypothetical protein
MPEKRPPGQRNAAMADDQQQKPEARAATLPDTGAVTIGNARRARSVKYS